VNIKTVQKWLGKRRLDKVENIFVSEWIDGIGIEIFLKDGYIVGSGHNNTIIEYIKQDDETWQDIKQNILFEFNLIIEA
jgi:meiotically up-regulated gene 157 (Mug157) protein